MMLWDEGGGLWCVDERGDLIDSIKFEKYRGPRARIKEEGSDTVSGKPKCRYDNHPKMK